MLYKLLKTKICKIKNMKTAFVTGGAGFIGSHLSELLLDKGWRVKILIREGDMHRAYNDVVYQEVIEMLKNKGAEIFYGNLYNIDNINSLRMGFVYVLTIEL